MDHKAEILAAVPLADRCLIEIMDGTLGRRMARARGQLVAGPEAAEDMRDFADALRTALDAGTFERASVPIRLARVIEGLGLGVTCRTAH